jgi:hypothetical protein
MVLHLQRVVNGDLGVPADALAQRLPSNSARPAFDDVERAGLVVEEVVVGAEEIFQAVGSLFSRHISSAMRPGLFRRCCRWL